MNDEHPTLGEIGRAVTRLETDLVGVRDAIRALEDKVPSKELVAATERAWTSHMAAIEARFNDKIVTLEEKFEDLDAWKTWALRIVMGAVLAALLALVLTTGGSAGS